MELKSFLREIDIFAPLSPDEIGLLAGLCESRTFARGDVIFRERDPGRSLFIVRSGAVEIGRAADGEERFIRLARLERGEVFGELALFDERPRSATAVAAVTPQTELVAIDKKALEKLFDEHVGIAAKVLKGVVRKISLRLRLADDALQSLARSLHYTGT